jgi:Short C-terminal domain
MFFMSEPDDYVKCRCQSCDKGIEFAAADLSDANNVINCPHCGIETTLYVPLPDGSRPPVVVQPLVQSPPLPGAVKLQWRDNELKLAGDQVIIRKNDVVSSFKYGTTGDHAIAIASITAIQVRHADLLNAGRIIFLYPGSTEDPDVFHFGMELNQKVDEFKTTVDSIMRSMRQSPLVAASANLPDEIRKLAELKKQGLLSEKEFEAAKKKLLA